MSQRSNRAEAIVAAFGQLPTAAVSDALDSLRIPSQALGIKPLDVRFRIAGRAFTVKYRAIGAVERGTVGDYIEDVGQGAVVVLDNGGRTDCTVWGDILTAVAVRRKTGGTVINGVCRDVTRAIEQGYPIFSRGNTMRTGKDRVEMDAINVPISLGEIQVRPGDIILGDADGIVVIPRVKEDEALEAARRIEDAEEAIERDVASGMALAEARKKHRYFALQSGR
jgi:4-hydroxy-4-methyl-2-oxoglutarate aldolase